ncbi:MAG: hypothetical protein JRN57_03855 [Nitrososphaerota archaeon]|nr:hypothetical protein [Nitrososphaerota archaeon]
MPLRVYRWAMAHDRVAALVLYSAATAAFFWPLLFNFFAWIPMGYFAPLETADGYHFLWNFWWVPQSLLSGHGIYFTNLMFYPQGTSLVLQTLDAADAVLSYPVQAVAGVVAAYNSVLIASTVACALAMYLYMRPYAGRSGAFLSGIVFSFFPQRMSQLLAGHPNLSSLEWFPLLLVCLRNAEGKKRYALGAGVCLALIAYTELELLVMAAMLLVLYMVYRLADGGLRGLRSWAVPMAVAIGTGAVLASPFLVPAALAANSRGVALEYLRLSGINNAANPLLLLIPSPTSWFLSQPFLGYYSGLSGGPSQWPVYIGWSVLALSALGGYLGRGRLRYFFVLVGAVSLLLSLGPGYGALSEPYRLVFEDITFLHPFRTPARLTIELMFAMAALAGMGTAAVLRPVGKRWGPRWRQVAALAIVGLVALEYAPAVALQSTQIPAWTSIIANDKGNFSVLTLPAGSPPVQYSLYYQSAFDKPLVEGKLSQVADSLPAYAGSMPYLSLLVSPYLSVASGDVFAQKASDANLSLLVLSMYRIKYVVVNDAYLSPGSYFILTNALLGSLGRPVYNDYEYQVYRLDSFVTPQAVAQEYGTTDLVLPSNGWETPYYGARNVTQSSALLVYSTVGSDYDLNIGAAPGLRWCAGSMNATFAAVCSTGDQSGTALLPGLQMVAGWNVLNLTLSASTAVVDRVQLVRS